MTTIVDRINLNNFPNSFTTLQKKDYRISKTASERVKCCFTYCANVQKTTELYSVWVGSSCLFCPYNLRMGKESKSEKSVPTYKRDTETGTRIVSLVG